MASWRGSWASGTAYTAGDSVTYAGSLYFCVTPATGQAPGSGADWQPMESFTGSGDITLTQLDLRYAPLTPAYAPVQI
jgi:hypothetical protein